MDKTAARKSKLRLKRMAKRRAQYCERRAGATSGNGADWRKCFKARPR